MKHKRLFGSILAAALSLALILGALPGNLMKVSAETKQQTVTDDPDQILKLEQEEPGELNKYPEEVYGVSKNQPFLLSEQNELGLIVSQGAGSKNEVDIFDNFNFEMKERDENGNCWVRGINFDYAGSSKKLSKNPYENVWDIQSIGLDADGTGRKQYIASVGFNANKAVTLIIQNAVTSDYKTIQIGANNSASETWRAYEWIIDNWVAITAGDYDGDGKDSVIIYVCENGDKPRLMEYTMGVDGDWFGQDVLYFRDVLRETRFTNPSVTDYRYKPCVSLATGDFNGDGRDQLAFSAGFYNTSNDVQVGYVNYECDNLERFATCVGIATRTSLGGWDLADPVWLYQREDDYYTNSDNSRTYPVTIMYAGTIAAGDVNNDGIDEIVAAGYVDRTKDETSSYYGRATYTKAGKLVSVDYVSNFSDKVLVSCVIKRSGSGYGKTQLKTFAINSAHQYTFKEFCNNQDWIFTKIVVACGKTNGNNDREDVFIDGNLYDFSGYLPSLVHETSFLNSDQKYLIGQFTMADVSVNFIRRVAVGNFDGNDAGREQFVFTFWQKKREETSYSSLIGVVTGVEYDDKTDQDDNIVSYGPPDFYGSNLNLSGFTYISAKPIFDTSGSEEYRVMIQKNATTDKALNATPVAIDVDDDGVVGRFAQRGYVYTDPEVLAVLEAGPYFSEVKAAGGYEDPCETSYGFAVGFGTSTTREDSVSFEVGFAGEVAAGPVKVSLEAGYAMDWSNSFEKSYKVTQTDGFAAQSNDLVVLTRIPVLIYTYDIWNKNTSDWVPNGMNVRVPLTPRYYTLGIDDYNDFVEEYNACVKGDETYCLKPIVMGVDLPADHIGNPENYWDDWGLAGGTGTSLTDHFYSLGVEGGYMSCEYEVEAAETETETMSHGFHFGLTVQGGGDFGPVGEAWAGGYTNLDYRSSTAHSTTKVNLTKSGGQVQNITGNDVEGLSKDEVRNSYQFEWSFGKWTRQLVNNGNGVPFYGYIVKNVFRRTFPPAIENWTEYVKTGYKSFNFANLTKSLNSNLTVTKVSGNSKITYDSKTKSIKVAAGLAAGTYSVQFKVSNGLASLDKTFVYKLIVKDTWVWTRFAGANRYDTATMASREAYADNSLKTIIVASGQSFPDALSGSALAGVYQCPVLLTNSQKLSNETKAEIQRLAASGCTVLILGGTGAVSEAVEKSIKALGVKTVRVAGSDREATAAAVYQKGKQAGGFKTGGTVIIATGYSFADALSISPYAYASKTPIILAKKNGSLSKNVKVLLASEGFTKAIIIGGTGCVSAESENYLKATLGMTVLRLQGNNRYETSANILKWETGQMSKAAFQPAVKMKMEGMGVATGSSFPDALGSISLLGKNKSPLLLVADNSKTNRTITQENINKLIKPKTGSMTKAYIFGGASTVSLQIGGWLNDVVE